MRPKLKDDVLDVLNDVLDTTEDACNGYRLAAEKVGNPDVARYLTNKADERGCFTGALRTLIEQRGQEPDEGGTVLAGLHRVWIDLRAAFSSDEGEQYLVQARKSWFQLRAEQVSDRAEAVIAECRRGERHSLKVLGDALDEQVGDGIRELLEFEAEQVKGALVEIESILETDEPPAAS